MKEKIQLRFRIDTRAANKAIKKMRRRLFFMRLNKWFKNIIKTIFIR